LLGITFTLKDVETPFSGTALLLVVAAGLWVVYLVPIWMRRSEYMATEKNAARLGQTMRLLAHTADSSEEIRTELTAREVAKQRRLAERKLQEVSYSKQELTARRRRVLRSTTTFFTVIGLAGLVSSISLQAAIGVTVALGIKTAVGMFLLLGISKHQQREQRKQVQAEASRSVLKQRTPQASARAWTPPALPEPLSANRAVVNQEVLPSREELVQKARVAAQQARPAEAAAEAKKLAPVSQFEQMGRIPTASSDSAKTDLDEVLRRRRAV
jgi:hypothetical protein